MSPTRPRAANALAAADIQRLLLSGQSHTRLKNGKFALLDTGAVEELQEVLLDCAPAPAGRLFRLDNSQAGFLEATLRRQPGWRSAGARTVGRSGPPNNAAKSSWPAGLGDLESVLRPYQKEASRGCVFCVTTASAEFWPTKWGWAKRCRCSRFCARWKTRPARPRWSSAPPPWCSTGRPRRKSSRRNCACWPCTARPARNCSPPSRFTTWSSPVTRCCGATPPLPGPGLRHRRAG